MGKVIRPIFFGSKSEVPNGVRIQDTYEETVRELFIIKNPRYKGVDSNKEFLHFLRNSNIQPEWIYFPWRKVAVRSVEEKIYHHIQTARNRNIITSSEQKKYHEARVGIIGMSIGSTILSSLVATGGPRTLHISDDDHIELSNLNRMNASLLDVGNMKSIVASQRAWEVNPYLDIHIFDRVKKSTLNDFLAISKHQKKLDMVVDAMDSLVLKNELRNVCKKHKIAVIMATSNGDNCIIDVERYDTDPHATPFHGRLSPSELSNLQYETQKEWVQKAVKIADMSILSKRVQESIPLVGKKLSGIPQLHTTVSISGSATSYIIRKIATGDVLSSGRYIIGLDQVFNTSNV